MTEVLWIGIALLAGTIMAVGLLVVSLRVSRFTYTVTGGLLRITCWHYSLFPTRKSVPLSAIATVDIVGRRKLLRGFTKDLPLLLGDPTRPLVEIRTTQGALRRIVISPANPTEFVLALRSALSADLVREATD